jgi:hypothetical protein
MVGTVFGTQHRLVVSFNRVQGKFHDELALQCQLINVRYAVIISAHLLIANTNFRGTIVIACSYR